MEISRFGVEEWMNAYEMDAKYNTGETCVESLTLKELLKLVGESDGLMDMIKTMKLDYGYIRGSEAFRNEAANLYQNMGPENILATHGGSGANFLAFYTLVNPGEKVVSVQPTYQQLYSIPESFQAEVKILELKYEDNFLPDLNRLEELLDDDTRLICLNNPNNPTGALIKRPMLEEIVELARRQGAYLLCDEVYHGLFHDPEERVPSVADLYEKGISVGSMSKVFSLAGLRMGWIAAAQEIIEECQRRRDYTIISCGKIDDFLAALALQNRDKIRERNFPRVVEQLEILDNWVAKEPAIDYVKPEAGSVAFLKYDLDISSREFCRRMIEERGVLLVPGSCFEKEGFFRLAFAGNRSELEKGLKEISCFIRNFDN